MEQLLGVDVNKWDWEQEDVKVSPSFYAFVKVHGMEMVAEAYRLVVDHVKGDEDEMVRLWDVEDDHDSEVVSVALDKVAPDAQGWRSNAEHNGGFQFNPVWVDAWNGHFAVLIVSAMAEPDERGARQRAYDIADRVDLNGREA